MKNIAYLCNDKNTSIDEKESCKHRNAREA